MPASWLMGPLVALVKPAVSAVAGDVYRRYRIQKKFGHIDQSPDSETLDVEFVQSDPPVTRTRPRER